MILSAIVAIAENGAIGKDNTLPWHLPEDLKFFKRTTSGKPVIMGRKTFESLGKPLVNRLNIVISTQKDLQLPEGVLLYHSVEDAVKRATEEDTDEAFIVGGGKIYEQSMQLLDRLYVTRVHTTIEDAHVFFPHIDHAHWKLSWKEEHHKDERHKYDFTFLQWDRIKEI